MCIKQQKKRKEKNTFQSTNAKHGGECCRRTFESLKDRGFQMVLVYLKCNGVERTAHKATQLY